MPNNKEVIEFYDNYLDKAFRWRGKHVPKEAVEEILEGFNKLSNKNKILVLSIILSEIRHCYKHPRISEKELEINIRYKEKLSNLKIFFIKYLFIGALVSLSFSSIIILVSYAQTIEYDIVEMATNIRLSIKAFLGL